MQFDQKLSEPTIYLSWIGRSLETIGLERRFESLIWKFRQIILVPVVMSLFGSVSCFVIGTYAEISVLSRVLQSRFTHTSSSEVSC